ncbi:hypothetical protein [Streptomyces sp. NPDC020571]
MQRVLGWQPAISVAGGGARYVRRLNGTPNALPGRLRQKAGQRV